VLKLKSPSACASKSYKATTYCAAGLGFGFGFSGGGGVGAFFAIDAPPLRLEGGFGLPNGFVLAGEAV
jgi:hypothetical protein